MSDRWNLATSSYSGFKPDMGVPVRTSLGIPTWFTAPHHKAPSLAPKNLKVSAEQYRDRLDTLQELVERELDAIADLYGADVPLVLLCWESKEKALSGGCHRRWAAEWFRGKYGLQIPEGMKTIVKAPEPEPEPELSLF